jgi:hypothetical protein
MGLKIHNMGAPTSILPSINSHVFFTDRIFRYVKNTKTVLTFIEHFLGFQSPMIQAVPFLSLDAHEKKAQGRHRPLFSG